MDYIPRWPTNPKFVVFAPPNAFKTELSQRFAIDLGVPTISIENLLKNISERAGSDPEYKHSFFQKVKDMYDAKDTDMIIKERIPLKLLRLEPTAMHGFVLTDYPKTSNEA